MSTAAMTLGLRPRLRSGPALRGFQLPLMPLILSTAVHGALIAGLIAAATVWRGSPPKIYIVNLVPQVAAVGVPEGRRKAPPAPSRRPAPARKAAPAERPVKGEAVKPPPPPAKTAPPERPVKAEVKPEIVEPPKPPPPKATPPERPVKAEVKPEIVEAPKPPPPKATPPERPVQAEVKPEIVKPPPPPPMPTQLPRLAPRTPTELPRSARATASELPRLSRPAPSELPPASAPPALRDQPLPPRVPALPQAGDKELPSLARPAPLGPALPRPAAPPAPASSTAAATVPPSPAAPPLGSPAGSVSGVGPVTLDVTDFRHAWYLREIERRIRDAWNPSPTSREGQHAVVIFEIDRDGQARRAAIEKTSGDPVYDLAALRAVVEASPFPKLPDDFERPPLRVHMGFTYRDRG